MREGLILIDQIIGILALMMLENEPLMLIVQDTVEEAHAKKMYNCFADAICLACVRNELGQA